MNPVLYTQPTTNVNIRWNFDFWANYKPVVGYRVPEMVLFCFTIVGSDNIVFIVYYHHHLSHTCSITIIIIIVIIFMIIATIIIFVSYSSL